MRNWLTTSEAAEYLGYAPPRGCGRPYGVVSCAAGAAVVQMVTAAAASAATLGKNGETPMDVHDTKIDLSLTDELTPSQAQAIRQLAEPAVLCGERHDGLGTSARAFLVLLDGALHLHRDFERQLFTVASRGDSEALRIVARLSAGRVEP